MVCRLLSNCALIAIAASAPAQIPGLGALGGKSGLGGSGLGGALSGLSGAALPNLSSVGASNATGVVSYCVKRKLVSATSAQSVLGKLTGQPAVTGSDAFADGQNGRIVTKNGQLSLDGMKDGIKGKVCSMVLDHARTLIGH